MPRDIPWRRRRWLPVEVARTSLGPGLRLIRDWLSAPYGLPTAFHDGRLLLLLGDRQQKSTGEDSELGSSLFFFPLFFFFASCSAVHHSSSNTETCFPIGEYIWLLGDE